MIRGPNVKTNFLENFVESWIFMYMMDSNKITPEMVYKFIDGMYRDTYPGFTKEFFVEVLNYDTYRKSEVVIHVLIDNEVYSQLINDRIGSGISTGEIIIDMEKKLKEIMNYLPYPYRLKIERYIDNGVNSFVYLRHLKNNDG